MTNLQTQLPPATRGNQDHSRLLPHLEASDVASRPIKRKPGRPQVDHPKQAVSLRLEPEVLAKFRATGAGWQRRMNNVLKAAKLGD